MANSVITLQAKNKLLRARAGEGTATKIVGFAFGSGGVDSKGNVLIPSSEQTALNNELIRKEVSNVIMQSDTRCTYECKLELNDVPGASISEMGVYDEDGDFIAFVNFGAKMKSNDVEMTFQIDDVF